MDKDQTNHAEAISDFFHRAMMIKYQKGALEHGGNLWEKDGLLDEAISEAIDQVVYLVTLKQQLEQKDGTRKTRTDTK